MSRNLLLRVTDVLTRNLVEECLEWDEYEIITKGAVVYQPISQLVGHVGGSVVVCPCVHMCA